MFSDSLNDAGHFVLPSAYTFRSWCFFPPDGKKKPVVETPLGNDDETEESLVEFMDAPQGHEETEEVLPPVRPDLNSQVADEPQMVFDNLPVGDSLDCSRVPARATFEERLPRTAAQTRNICENISGSRRTSTTDQEDRNLITVSSTVTSPLHKHWLRPCAVYVRSRQLRGQSRRLVKKHQRHTDEAAEKVERTRHMYRRSLFWIKKQEDKMMQPQV